MSTLKTVLYATLGTGVLLPLVGLQAQMLEEEGETLAPIFANKIELGIGYNSEDSYKFGKFNGLEDSGAFLIGNFDLRQTRPAGDDSREYWALSGTNLGLDSRNAYGQYSRYGQFSVYFDFDQRVNNLYDDARTPFLGSGTPVLTLPSNWVSNTGNNGVGSLFGGNTAALFASMNDVSIEKDRKKYGGGGSWDISDIWQLTANYHHEDKEGTDEFGAVFGNSGGNPKAADLVFPHNFAFDEFDVGVAYKGEKGQFTITYNLSIFDNEIDSLRFTNPFSRTSGWGTPAAITNYPAVGQIGNIFPDNDAWTVNFSGGYNWSNRTRMTANVSYGEMNQDEAFLPFTSIPQLAAAATQPLPRANLDGSIDNLYANVNLTHRFTNELDVKARYTHDNRDNTTPQDLYYRIAGDSQFQVAIDSARVNRPYSFERNKFEIDGSYRLPRMSKLTVGYVYEDIDRDYQERANAEEYKIHVKLSTAPADWISAWAHYTYSSRDGSAYISNQPLLDSHDPGVIAALIAADPLDGDLYENDILTRKYYMADRDTDLFNANVSLIPNEEVVVSLAASFADDEYPESEAGLLDSTRGSMTLDLAYRPADAFSANAFFTVEKNDFRQRAFARTGSQNPTVADRITAFGNNWWQVTAEESVYTTGMSFEWEVIKDKFNLSLDTVYSDATTDITPYAEDIANATRISNVTDFTDVDTRVYRIILEGDYKLKEGWGTRLYYWYERYDSTDFAVDSIDVNALANGGTGGNVLLMGYGSPTYNAHVIGVTLYHKF